MPMKEFSVEHDIMIFMRKIAQMKNKHLVIITAALIAIVLFSIGLTLYRYPVSRAQLSSSPESSIAQAMSAYEPESAAQDIKILAQYGNQKERVIVYEYKGKPMSAIAVGKLAGLRYDLLVADLYNSGGEDGGQKYDSSRPAFFLLHGYFHEARYAYLDGQFTLTESVFSLHHDIVWSLLRFIIIVAAVFISWHKKRKK